MSRSNSNTITPRSNVAQPSQTAGRSIGMYGSGIFKRARRCGRPADLEVCATTSSLAPATRSVPSAAPMPVVGLATQPLCDWIPSHVNADSQLLVITTNPVVITLRLPEPIAPQPQRLVGSPGHKLLPRFYICLHGGIGKRPNQNMHVIRHRIRQPKSHEVSGVIGLDVREIPPSVNTGPLGSGRLPRRPSNSQFVKRSPQSIVAFLSRVSLHNACILYRGHAESQVCRLERSERDCPEQGQEVRSRGATEPIADFNAKKATGKSKTTRSTPFPCRLGSLRYKATDARL